MIRTFAVAIAAAIAMTACSGGGGSTPVTPPSPPVITPPAPHTLSIGWTGENLPKAYKDAARKPQSIRHTLDVTTGLPVILTVPDCDSSHFATCANSSYSVAPGGGDTRATLIAEVQPSPNPSTSPSAAFSSSNTQSSEVTPVTNQPLEANLVATVPDAATSYSVSTTVTQTGLLPLTASKTTYQFHRFTLACWPADQSGNNVDQSQYWQGIKFVNGGKQQAASPSDADIYFTGQGCWGAFNGPESIPTIHTPYGATFIADNTKSILDLTLAQYTGTTTTTDIQTLRDDAHNGATPESLIILNTALGDKIYISLSLYNEGQGSPMTGAQISGPYYRHGDAPGPN